MFKGRNSSSAPTLRLVTAARRQRPKRVFRAELRNGEIQPIGVTRRLLERYFEGIPEQEKQPVRYSLLFTLLISILSFFIVWPTVLKQVEIQKKDELVYTPGQAAASLASPKRQQRQRVIREELVPQLYPKLEEVNIITDEDLDIEIDDWSNLDIDSSLGGVETGYGAGGLGGPVLTAGQGDVPEPELIYRVQPDYPEPARRARVDGFVLLEAIVNKRGDVVDVKVLQSPPSRYGFAEKAIAAVEQWKFKPAIYRGRPINVRIRFSVEFNLLY